MENPEYQTFENRLRTFRTYPLCEKKISLAEAGFFSSSGDSATCFFCGLVLRNWRRANGRSPLEYHAHFTKSCCYIIVVEGRLFHESCRKDKELDRGPEVVE